MLFLGESAHRRFPQMSLQFAVHRSPFTVAGCSLISPIGRIGPSFELLTRIEPVDTSCQHPRLNCQLQTVNGEP